jgi:hypothetical protein
MNAEETQRRIREIEKLRSRALYWRYGFTVALVLIVAVCLWTLYSDVHGLTDANSEKQKEFISQLNNNLNQDVVPDVQELVGRAVTEAKPGVEAGFKKINDRMPELSEASMKQLETLQTNLAQKGEKVLEDTYGTTLANQEKKIHAMYPDVTEDKVKTMVDNLTKAGQERIVHAHDALFSGHVQAIDGIVGSLDKIQREEPVNPSSEKSTWEMAILLLDLVKDDLQAMQPVDTTAGGKVKAGKVTVTSAKSGMAKAATKPAGHARPGKATKKEASNGY